MDEISNDEAYKMLMEAEQNKEDFKERFRNDTRKKVSAKIFSILNEHAKIIVEKDKGGKFKAKWVDVSKETIRQLKKELSEWHDWASVCPSGCCD